MPLKAVVNPTRPHNFSDFHWQTACKVDGYSTRHGSKLENRPKNQNKKVIPCKWPVSFKVLHLALTFFVFLCQLITTAWCSTRCRVFQILITSMLATSM